MQSGSDREMVLAIGLSDWMSRVWTMQEAMLSTTIIFLQQDRYHIAKEMFTRLMLYCDDGADHHWKQYGALSTLAGIVQNQVPVLDRIIRSGRQRKTSRREDQVRALFPLFDLSWPGSTTTLEEGQILLLQHLGRSVFLFGSVGLPSPWNQIWLPSRAVFANTCSRTVLASPERAEQSQKFLERAEPVLMLARRKPNSPL